MPEAHDLHVTPIRQFGDPPTQQMVRICNANFRQLKDVVERLKLTNGLITVGDIEHGDLDGLTDDDHVDYHTDGRALIWLGTRSTTDLPEGTNLYYTDARWQTAWDLKTLVDLVSGTEGDILYYTGSGWANLAAGTNGYVLTLAGGVPTWAASGGGGGAASYVSSGSIGWIWVGGFPLEIV
jgi:hypothetical protein